MAKNLSQMNAKKLQCFLNSFDIVLSDCDGVLWILDKLIPGALESLKTLQDLGKRIQLVSNNSTSRFKDFQEKVKGSGLKLQPEQLTIPSTVIAWYLNQINFRDEAFVIGCPTFRETLVAAGIKVMPPDFPPIYEDNIEKSIASLIESRKSKAIIIDFSLKTSWKQLAYAINCLKNEDLLYLCGMNRQWAVAGQGQKLLAAGPFTDLVSRLSGKKPIECAKPSKVLKDHVMKICEIKDPKRCLFIGDSISTDMMFANECGFQKLFVQTGMDDLQSTLETENTRPDYYISTLGSLTSIIESRLGNVTKSQNS